MEQAKAAVECAEQVAETEQRVVQLESQAQEAAVNAASSQGMAEFLANNAAAMERAAAQHASESGQYAEAAEEAAQKAQQYAESGGVPDSVYDPNSDNAQSGKAVAQALAEISGGGVIYLSKDEANYETIKAELDSGKEVIIVDNDGSCYRRIYDDGESISFASQGDSYYKGMDYFINFVSEYEGNLVREEDVQHVYDANSDKPISGKAVAEALATTSGGGESTVKGLTHLKSITLDEAVSRVEIEFDNPVNEFYLYISGTCKGYEDMPATFSFGVCETETETETLINSQFNDLSAWSINGDFEVIYLQHIRVLSGMGYCTTTTETLQYKSVGGGVETMLVDMREPGFEMIPKPNANQIKKIVCSVVDITGGANVQFGAGQKFDVWGVEV
jgi:hypothetical protein